MNGPEHYLEGERLLAESADTALSFSADKSHALAVQAQAHFLAALAAAVATGQHPNSITWRLAVNPPEQG